MSNPTKFNSLGCGFPSERRRNRANSLWSGTPVRRSADTHSAALRRPPGRPRSRRRSRAPRLLAEAAGLRTPVCRVHPAAWRNNGTYPVSCAFEMGVVDQPDEIAPRIPYLGHGTET